MRQPKYVIYELPMAKLTSLKQFLPTSKQKHDILERLEMDVFPPNSRIVISLMRKDAPQQLLLLHKCKDVLSSVTLQDIRCIWGHNVVVVVLDRREVVLVSSCPVSPSGPGQLSDNTELSTNTNQPRWLSGGKMITRGIILTNHCIIATHYSDNSQQL